MNGLLLAGLLVGCSSHTKTAGDGSTAPHDGAAHPGDAGSGSALTAVAAADGALPVATPPAPTTGDVQVRVEWTAVPVSARASPGTSACQTPRAASVSPTTTWGIPEAIVIVEGAPAPTGAAATARILLAACAFAPRVVAATSLLVASGVDHPVVVKASKIATLDALDKLGKVERGRQWTTLQLPIAGHELAPALDANGVYEVSTTDTPSESAWIITAVGAITDPTGQVIVKDLPPGTHAVTAWLPPRGGQRARIAHGSVEVTAGELADVTVALE